MTMIQRILDKKGRQVWTIHPDATVYDAILEMSDRDIGALVVVEPDSDKIVGLVTERDYARNVFLKGRSSPDTAVNEIMETNVVYARPEQTVDECMAIMTETRVRHLPVVKDGKLDGLVSMGDLIQSKVDDQQFTIEQLINYIHGIRA